MATDPRLTDDAPVPGTRPKPSALRYTMVGAGLGLTWGMAMRGWMRFITTNPEFSWSGTLMIITASTVVGTLLGFARYRREVGGVGWWRFTLFSLLVLGAGGSVMWPTVVVGGFTMGRLRNIWWRGILLLVAAGLQIPTIQDAILGNPTMTGAEMAVGIVWYLPMIALEAWGFSVCFAPRSDRAPEPGRLKRVIFAIPVGVMVLMSGLVLGIGGP
jgi:hypothetical protein